MCGINSECLRQFLNNLTWPAIKKTDTLFSFNKKEGGLNEFMKKVLGESQPLFTLKKSLTSYFFQFVLIIKYKGKTAITLKEEKPDHSDTWYTPMALSINLD